jgi:hypothetical protein
MDATFVIISASCVAASTPAALAGVRAYRLYSGLRLISCPETAEEAIVKIRATRAMASTLVGRNDVRLRSCSRWPEKKGCDQSCVAQIAASPNGCRARVPARSATPQAATWVSEEFYGSVKQRPAELRPRRETPPPSRLLDL